MNHHTLHFSLCLFLLKSSISVLFSIHSFVWSNLLGHFMYLYLFSQFSSWFLCISVVHHNRMCKVTLSMKLKYLHYLARKALKCISIRFAKVMCELLGCINKSKTKLYKLAARFFCCAVHTVVEAL
jgi:hypothetical protein